jgi:malonate transporter
MNVAALFGVLWSFAAIGSIMGVGYFAKRVKFFTAESDLILNRVTVYIGVPTLYFAVIAEGGSDALNSRYSFVSMIAMGAALLLALVLLKLMARTYSWGETMMLATTAVNPNSGNTGIPLAVAVLGSTVYLAPVILIQVAVLTPLVLIVVELTRPGTTLRISLKKAFLSPLVLAALAGVIVAATGVELAAEVLLPIKMIGEASIPLMLMVFGSSLRGAQPFLTLRRHPVAVVLPIAVKGVLLPLIAVGIGVAFGLQGIELLALALVGSLPVAQNLYAMAHALGTAAEEVKSIIILSTLSALPLSLFFVMLFA